MLTGICCLIVIKVIYTQNIPTHVREWPSILLHVVLMSINICLRALYIMDNNVGALQTIPLGGATRNFTGENKAKQPSPEWPSSLWVRQTLISSSVQMRPEASPLPGWKSEMRMGVRPFEMGRQGLDPFRNKAPWIRVLLLDHDAVPRKDSHAATQPRRWAEGLWSSHLVTLHLSGYL